MKKSYEIKHEKLTKEDVEKIKAEIICSDNGQIDSLYINGVVLVIDENEIFLMNSEVRMHCDFKDRLPRLNEHNLNRELLVRAVGYKSGQRTDKITIADATAGLGEDSLILAAAGFNVIMYEKDPVVAALLRDSLRRAALDSQLNEMTARMHLIEGSSIDAFTRNAYNEKSAVYESNMSNNAFIRPDIIYLDPMFPERSKSGLVKKKFQLLHFLERPCDNEEELLNAAINAEPEKIIIKRPLKGPVLAGIKPAYSIKGKH